MDRCKYATMLQTANNCLFGVKNSPPCPEMRLMMPCAAAAKWAESCVYLLPVLMHDQV